MPRIVEITVPSDRAEELVGELRVVEPLSIRLHRGASLQPPGDVVAVDVTDRNLGAVMTLAQRFGVGNDPSVSLTTSRPDSVVSAGDHERVVRDTTSSSPEEVELAIGRESTMTAMKTLVMVTAGFVAALGLATGALHLVIGAMVIAPGFEPFSRIGLGVARGTSAWRRGLHDVVKAYLGLAVGAAVAAALSSAIAAGALDGGSAYLTSESLISYFSTTTWTSFAIAVVAGLGGGVLLVTNRRVLTAGVMIALGLIPALAIAAMAVVAADLSLAARAGGRWLVDAVIVTVMSAAVFAVQRQLNKRQRGG